MTKGSIDRRVDRTRTALHNALLSLILTRDYDAITVEDICEMANVGRSTFYAHYMSKDDLKRSGIDDHLRHVLAGHQREAATTPGGGNPSCRFGFSLAMFEHAREHQALYRALAGGRGGAITLTAMRKMLSDLIRIELASDRPVASPQAPPLDFTVQFVVGAYMAILIWWLDGGAKLAPQKVDAMFRQLITEGVAQDCGSAHTA